MTSPTDQFAGKRHSSADQKDMQDLHDISVRQGAACMPANARYSASLAVDFLSGDEFKVSAKAGEPYLWMQYGPIWKDGKLHNVTPEYAQQFKLPPFKPPVKLGSHADDAPAGGHILKHELREDGIWVYPEYVPNGEKAVTEGHYKYHSPEVVWSGFMEDSHTGQKIEGPFIWGDALLHTPHLGESTALYSAKEQDMSETVTVPVSWLDKFMGGWKKDAPLEQAASPIIPTPAPAVDVEKYNALQAEADKYKAEVENMKALAARSERVSKFSAEVAKTKAVPAGLPELLADLPDEKAELVLTQFRALSAQIEESKLTRNIGASGTETSASASDALHAVVTSTMAELKLNSYNDALEVVKTKTPELFSAYVAELSQRKGK
jgi:hypothetical protein